MVARRPAGGSSASAVAWLLWRAKSTSSRPRTTTAPMTSGKPSWRRWPVAAAAGPGRPGDLLGRRCLAHGLATLSPTAPGRRPGSAAPGSRTGRAAPRTGPRRRAATAAGRRPALDERAGRPRPIARPGRGRRAGRSSALVKASGSSGGTARPAPARSTVRATSVPGSTLATTGRPAARIEYSFDGTLDLGQAPRSGTTWMSAGGQHLGQPSAGWKSTKRTLSRPAARRSRPGRAEPPPLTTNTTDGSCWRATAASSSRSSAGRSRRCRRTSRPSCRSRPCSRR